MAAPPALKELAKTVSETSEIVSDYLAEQNLPQPSFAADAPVDWPLLPKDVEDARSRLRDASRQLSELSNGARNELTWLSAGGIDLANLNFIYRYKLADAVPLAKAVPFSDVAKASNVNEALVKRVMRLAMLNYIFTEPKPGHVAHTAKSALIRSDGQSYDMLGFSTEEITDYCSHLPSAYKKYGSEMEIQMDKTAFALASGQGKPYFEWFQDKPEIQNRFQGMMMSMKRNEGYGDEQYVRGYDWGSLGEATVVDVGGGIGNVAVSVAQQHPMVKFVVEDVADTVRRGETELPAAVKDRVTFKVHDFFTPQPVEHADIYMTKQVLHDWPIPLCSSIIKNIVPAMGPKSKILIFDAVLPESGKVLKHEEKWMRMQDILMLSMFGAKEKALSDYEQILQDADSRLRIKSVVKPFGSVNSIIEIFLEQ